MSRLSREKKREQQQAAHVASPAAPVDVRVPRAGADPGAGPGAGAAGGSHGASVGGVPVFAAPGEEIQQAVLDRLHHIALATGHPVLATVHDERIGYVVPLQVDPDGSSHFTAEPVRTTPPEDTAPAPHPPRETPTAAAVTEPPAHEPGPVPPAPGPMPPASEPGPVPHASEPGPMPPAPTPGPMPPTPEPGPVPPVPESQHPQGDSATHILRPLPESGRGAPQTFPLRAVTEPQPAEEPAPTFQLRAVQEPPEPTPEDTPPGPVTPPGTVMPPTGQFGPPPSMDARPLPVPEAGPVPNRRPAPGRLSEAELLTADPDPKPAPARGFDAVAEAVLGDEPFGAPGDPATPALLAEPIARISEAVKDGRIDAAAGLADQTVAEASATLGPEHPEVLRLGELTAYVAYLAGDPVRAFRLSLDLAGAHRRSGDAEAAYGNVQSAATSWRAVRDPALGLELGRDLIALWTELAAEDGPAAEETEGLEAARARMGRLTERARTQ